MDPALFWSSWTLFPADVVVLSAVVVASCSEKKQMRIDLLQMPSTQFFSYSKSRYCKMLSKPQEGSKGFQKVCYFRTRSARHSASDYYCSRSRSDLINFELSILSCVVAQLNNSSVDLPVHWECCFFSRAFWQWSNRQSTWRWEEVCTVRYPVTEKENVRSQKIF